MRDSKFIPNLGLRSKKQIPVLEKWNYEYILISLNESVKISLLEIGRPVRPNRIYYDYGNTPQCTLIAWLLTTWFSSIQM